MKTMPEMNEFALRCHVASEAKGWTNLKRTDAQTINLMVSELSEALEDFRDKRPNDETYYEAKIKSGEQTVVKKVSKAELNELWKLDGKFGRGDIFLGAKPCGIPIELADAVIRIGQQCGTHKLDLADAMERTRGSRQIKKRTDLNEMIADATLFLSCAWFNSPQQGEVTHDGPGVSMVECFAKAMWSILFFCESSNIDIWAAVEEKMAFNETREQLHGGKAI